MGHTEISLLELLQGVIERTYDLQTGVRDIGRYVIGDEGYRRIYGADHAAGRVRRSVIVGAGARILGPVQIGDRAVIGANAVVTADVPEDSVAVGVPAKCRPWRRVRSVRRAKIS